MYSDGRLGVHFISGGIRVDWAKVLRIVVAFWRCLGISVFFGWSGCTGAVPLGSILFEEELPAQLVIYWGGGCLLADAYSGACPLRLKSRKCGLHGRIGCAHLRVRHPSNNHNLGFS